MWRVTMKSGTPSSTGKFTCVKRSGRKYAFKSAHNRYMRAINNAWVD